MNRTHFNFLRDLERLEKYDNNNEYTQIFFWQAKGRLTAYREVLGYDICHKLDEKWENELKLLPEGLRWNVMACPTLREPKDGETGCFDCSNYEEDPEVDSCIKFGLSHGMDDSPKSNFSGYICDEFNKGWFGFGENE